MRCAAQHKELLHSGMAAEGLYVKISVRKRLSLLVKITHPKRTGSVAALERRARVPPAMDPHGTPVGRVLSPSLRMRTGDIGSAAAPKCVSPAISRLKKKTKNKSLARTTPETCRRRRAAGTARAPSPCHRSTRNTRSQAPVSCLRTHVDAFGRAAAPAEKHRSR